MPKRKYSDDDDSDKIMRKIRKIERKWKKHRKRLRRNLDSSSSDSSTPCNMTVPSTSEDVVDLLPVYELPDEFDDDIAAPSTADSAATSPPVPTLVPPPAPVPPPPPSPAAPAPTDSSAPITDPPNNAEKSTDDGNIVLDEDILHFLGEAPNKDKKYGPKIQHDIANRWEYVATTGVTKDVRKEMQEKYLTPENCSLIDPPALNLEVKAALSDTLQKKDIAIQNKQKQITAAISCLGQALNRTLSQDNKDTEMIKLLIDAGRIICDVQHTESMMRRGFIGSCIKKDVKDHLNDTRIDKYLFGEKLADTLKAAKSIHKSGSEIRASTSTTRPLPKTKPVTRPLNSKAPAPTSRPSPAGRRLEEAPLVPPPPRRRPPPPPPAPRSHQRPRAPRR